MKTILIVDDDEKIAKGLAVRLRAAGYRTLTAPDPAFAIMMITTERPDLLILDIWLPVIQGFGFAQRLDGLKIGKIPVIFITASRKEGLREAAAQMGAAGFFEKPYDPEELLRAVRKALEKPTEETRIDQGEYEESIDHRG